MKALAIDLGGTHATCALVEDRAILRRESISADRAVGLGPRLPELAGLLNRILSQAKVSARECAGLALSFCGMADHSQGKITSTNQKYDDGPSLDLQRWCREAFGIPFQIENDARMALLGERYCGAAQGCDDLVMVTLGTGIGAATMIQGELLRGKHAQAGCLGGHIPALFNGRDCTCGAVGCAEAEASTWALPDICRSTPGFASSALSREDSIGFEVLFRLASQGDAVAIVVRDRCLAVWSSMAVGLVHAYDPDLFVIGGGVMKRAEEILPPIQAYVHRHAWTPWGKVEFRRAQLGNEAGLHGAIPLLEASSAR
jgi:glucokinase